MLDAPARLIQDNEAATATTVAAAASPCPLDRMLPISEQGSHFVGCAAVQHQFVGAGVAVVLEDVVT
ncbi:hypothetical protein JHV675_04300 [Mycobacterium avium subsp. hominissuis]